MAFLEHENRDPKLSINKIKMNCDQRPAGLSPKLQWHFFSIISGTPGSGKSNLLINLIKRKNKNYNKLFDRVYIFSPSLNTIESKIDLPDEQLFPDLDMDKLTEIIETQEIDNTEDILIIIDDLVSSIKKNNKELLRLVFNRRHLNISIFITTQKYNNIPLELRTAASSVFLFKIVNKSELSTIKKELAASLDSDEFDDLIKAAFKERYDFLYIRLDTGQFFRNFNELELQT